MDEKLLLPEEVAERLRVSRITVMRLLREGKLRGIKTQKLWRVREEDLEAFIQGNQRGGTLPHYISPQQYPVTAESMEARGDVVCEKVQRGYLVDKGLGTRPRGDRENLRWLDAELADFPPYDWGPAGPPKAKPVRYIPGVGLIVEGEKDHGK